jgi:hypothetical protein
MEIIIGIYNFALFVLVNMCVCVRVLVCEGV